MLKKITIIILGSFLISTCYSPDRVRRRMGEGSRILFSYSDAGEISSSSSPNAIHVQGGFTDLVPLAARGFRDSLSNPSIDVPAGSNLSESDYVRGDLVASIEVRGMYTDDDSTCNPKGQNSLNLNVYLAFTEFGTGDILGEPIFLANAYKCFEGPKGLEADMLRRHFNPEQLLSDLRPRIYQAAFAGARMLTGKEKQ